MSNTLTRLLPDMYEAMDVISREMIGYIPAVTRDSSAERAAIGQDVLVPVSTPGAAADNTPGVNAPNTGDDTVENVPIKITKSKHVPVRWNGEETKGLENAGTFSTIAADRFYQAMRVLVNMVEADVHTAAISGASRAYGTAGTTPYGTAGDMTDFAGVLRILEENGAPKNDLQLVNGHSAIGNLRGKQSGLFKVNEAGSSDMLRNGMTDRLMGFAMRHSDAIAQRVKGTGAGYLVNSAALAIGSKSIPVDTGAGTILAGDIITFAGDSNKYVVNAFAGGVITLGGNGLRVAVADNAAVTVGNNYTPNVGFARSAIVLAARAPAMPKGGDAAAAVEQVIDPISGLTFEIALYKQFLQNVFHVRLAWGAQSIKPCHIGILVG